MTGMKVRPIWIILGLAVVLRAALLLSQWGKPEHFFTPDSVDYTVLADSLLQHGQFARAGEPEIFRTPVYPVFVAAIFAATNNSVQAVVAVQIVLDVLLCWLVYRLGVRMCDERVGLAAAVFQAVAPAAIVSSVRLLTEGMFALLLTGSLLLLVEFLQDRRRWAALPAGLLMGLACLVRPIGTPMAALTAILLLSAGWRRKPSSDGTGQTPVSQAITQPESACRRRWPWALGFAAIVALTLAPWLIRNRVQTGYTGIAGVSDFNLFYCNALALAEVDPSVQLSPEQAALWELKKRTPLWPRPEQLNDPALLRAAGKEGKALIAAYPLAYANVHMKTAPNIFLPAATDVLEVLGVTSGNRGTLAVLRQQGLAAAIRHYFGGQVWPLLLCLPMLLILAGTYAAAVVGAVRTIRWHMSPPLRLVVLAFVYFALTPGPVAHARFRVPIEPIISLAAGAGAVWLAKRLRK
jgi:hypothetical protein